MHRSGAVRRPHFAHHTKRPSESCLLGSALLAHQSGLLGLAGRVVDLPFPVDPMAAGAEPWLMDRRLAVESVALDVGFVLPDGDWQEVDAVLVGRDGRRVGVVVSTKGSATGGRTWMESVGLPTLKCRMDEAVAAGEATSSADMLAGAVWLWEPYSAPLREAMAAHRAKERFRGLESQLAACAGLLDFAWQTAGEGLLDFAWQTAGEDPLGAHGTLRFVDDLLGETEPDDEFQRDGWRRLKAQFAGVWDVAHRLVEDTLLDEYRDLVSKLGGGAGDELRTIEADRFGSTLRTNTRNLVNSRAQRIAGLGFRQQDSRATLFGARLGRWRVFADLDSTQANRMWEVDCVPAIYAFPVSDAYLVRRERLLLAVGELFEGAGIPYRRYFEDRGLWGGIGCPICGGEDDLK